MLKISEKRSIDPLLDEKSGVYTFYSRKTAPKAKINRIDFASNATSKCSDGRTTIILITPHTDDNVFAKRLKTMISEQYRGVLNEIRNKV